MKKIQQGFTLIELMIVVAIIAILAAIALPAYQDYVARSQVSEAASLASGARTAVAEQYANTANFKAITDNSKAGLPTPASIKGTYVTSVTVGEGKITAKLDEGRTSAKVKGKNLVYSPFDQGGSVSWTCGTSAGTDIDAKYLPSVCRPQ